MRRETLGERLRAIVLATPFVAAMAGVGCNPTFGPCYPPQETYSVALWLLPDGGITDGGAYWASPGVANGAVLDGNGILDAGCLGICNAPSIYRGVDLDVTQCGFEITDSGVLLAASCTGTPGCLGGRAPFTLVDAKDLGLSEGGCPVGSFFARAARLEAASVHAFRILARELRVHGAPAQLIAAARRSALDEVRHTRLTSALASRHGAQPFRPVLEPAREARSLEVVALENAVEGCARETYGAAVGLWQARHARDAEVKTAIESIADDEVRHAELSCSVAKWAEPRLSQAARSRTAEARAKAFDQLELEASVRVPSQLVAVAGLPPSEMAICLARAVRTAVLEA
jgi:hypothetical protein